MLEDVADVAIERVPRGPAHDDHIDRARRRRVLAPVRASRRGPQRRWGKLKAEIPFAAVYVLPLAAESVSAACGHQFKGKTESAR